MNIPQWLFQEPIEKKTENVFNTKTLRQIGRDNNGLVDK